MNRAGHVVHGQAADLRFSEVQAVRSDPVAIDFGEQSGTALIADGQWKVSRATCCTVMAGPAATCPAP